MESPLGKSTIASVAGIGAPLLALGLVVVVAVVTSRVTGSALFFESFCGVILTAMLWVLPSGPFRTGDWTAPATPAAVTATATAMATALVRRLRMGIRSSFGLGEAPTLL